MDPVVAEAGLAFGGEPDAQAGAVVERCFLEGAVRSLQPQDRRRAPLAESSAAGQKTPWTR
jgi:hypothetical protein